MTRLQRAKKETINYAVDWEEKLGRRNTKDLVIYASYWKGSANIKNIW